MMTKITYAAFISYRHKELDTAVAKAVHKQLETYRIPYYIQKTVGRKKIGKVFRDQDELPLLADLGKGIRLALEQSEWLIIICTPDLPLSKWCMAEVDYFISLGRKERILTVLAAGEPEVSFPEQLCEDQEPLAADVRAGSIADSVKMVRREKLRLLAPILTVGYDDLRRRQRERLLRSVAGVSIAVALLSAGAGAYVLNQNQLLAEQQRLTQEQRDQALISQSRFLAELSATELARGDRVTAALLALEALPENLNDPDRPLTPEAVTALRNSEILAVNTDFQPVFTVESTRGVHSFSRIFRNTRSYHLYEDTLVTVADRAIYLHSVSNGELLGSVPLDPLKGRPNAVVFMPVTAGVYLIYESGFQIAYPLRNTISEEIKLSYDGYFSPGGGVAWSGGVFIYGFADEGEYWPMRGGNVGDQQVISLAAGLPFTCAVLSPDSATYSYVLATGHEADKDQTKATVNLWDANSGDFLRALPIGDEIHSLAFSANRTLLAAVTKAGYVSLFNPSTGTLLYELNRDDLVKPDHYQATEVCFSPDSTTLAVRFSNGIVRLYDAATGLTKHDLQSTGLVLQSVCWSADGTELLCAAGDENAYLFEAASGEQSKQLNSNGDLLGAVFLNQDTILLEHGDGSLHLFARSAASEIPGVVTMTGESLLWDGLLSPDDTLCVSSTFNGQLHIYDGLSGKLLRQDTYPEPTNTGISQIKTMSWRRDGSGQILIQAAHQAAIWDPLSGDWRLSITPKQVSDYLIEISNLSDNADGTLLALNTQADWIHIHDAGTGAQKALFRHNPDSPDGINHVFIKWSPTDTDRLLTYRTRTDDPQNQVNIWNSQGELQFSINSQGNPVNEAIWSPDGNYILCADGSGVLCIYHVSDGSLAAELAERPYAALHCTWSPDGKQIAFYVDSRTAWLWDWQAGKLTSIRKPELISANDRALPSWSPDSRMIYLYGNIYDAASGKAVMNLPDQAPSSVPVNWTADSNGVLLKQNRYTLRLWTIRPVEELMTEAVKRLDGRKLTADERQRFFLDQ